LIRVDGKIWIPDSETSLKLKLLSIAHAGESGHRGIESTVDAITSKYYWDNLTTDVKAFVADCLLCILSKSGRKIPRPLSMTTHASKPGQILHFDFLYLGKSSGIEKYVLALKDDLSSYCWIVPVDAADSENAARILSQWIRTFTAPEIWISDQGPHFINETLSALAQDFHILHQPTVAYAPWANGTAESLMRNILAALTALILELKLAPQDWKEIISAVQTILNSASLPRLGRNEDGSLRSPLQVMTGIRPNRPIARIEKTTSIHETKLLDTARAAQIINIQELQNAVDLLHKDVSTKVTTRRKQAIAAHNKATNIVEPKNFTLVILY